MLSQVAIKQSFVIKTNLPNAAYLLTLVRVFGMSFRKPSSGSISPQVIQYYILSGPYARVSRELLHSHSDLYILEWRIYVLVTNILL